MLHALAKVGMTSKIAGEPHTPRESWTRIAKSASPVGSPRPECTVIISAPPAASRQSSEPAPSRASCPSPPCVVHASSGPSGSAPTSGVGHVLAPPCILHFPQAIAGALQGMPSWCVRHIARLHNLSGIRPTPTNPTQFLRLSFAAGAAGKVSSFPPSPASNGGW